MSMLTLYFFTVLGKMGATLVGIICGSVVAIIGISIYYVVDCSDDFCTNKSELEERKKMVKTWNLRFIKTIIFCAILNLFIPSLKETAFIYIVGKVSQNEQLQAVPDQALKILNLKLNEYLKDFDVEGEVKK